MKEYDIYLFDADGTLTDTAELIYKNYCNTCREYGKPEPSREAVVTTIGIPLKRQMELFIGALDDDGFTEAAAVHMQWQTANYSNYIRLFEGIEPMLAALKERGKKLAVVTSRRRESLVRYLDHCGVTSYFEHLITPEDTTVHKPQPEPVLEALSRFDEGSALFIGDSRFDMECGEAAGVDTCFVNWSVSGMGDSTATPTVAIDRAEELLAW